MKTSNYYECPICGKYKFNKEGDYDICKYCGWENDPVMNADPTYWGGANDLCQIDFKLRYSYYVERNPKYHWALDGYPEIPQIEKCVCPVCGKFEFEPLAWDDIYCGTTPSDVYCMSCGWHYSPEQEKSTELENGANAMSLKEYRAWYAEKIAVNPNYSYFEEMTENYVPTPHKCPVCGKYEFADESCYDICPFCGWEDDGVQLSDPDFIGGANELSLKQSRKQYREIIKTNPNYRWDRDNK